MFDVAATTIIENMDGLLLTMRFKMIFDLLDHSNFYYFNSEKMFCECFKFWMKT